MASNHPLPPPPGQQLPHSYSYQQEQHHERPGARQRSKTSFSYNSNHSRKSSGSNHPKDKVDLTETSAEKASKRLTSKANPNMAVAEAEPSAIAENEKSQLAPLRAIQHRDSSGNIITDPDRSNPTRPRWERPLDTIRSFEAAIDGVYTRKNSSAGTEGSTMGMNRRSSYMGGPQGMNSPRPNEAYYAANGRGSYYNNGRPESYYNGNGGHNGMSRPESSFDHYNGNGYQHQPQRQRYPRTASEGAFHNGHAGVYPTHGNQPSYETVTTASGGSADPIGYQTDPSSDNSSLDRVPPVTNPTDNYGFEGFGNVPPMGGPGYDQYAQMSGGIPAGYPPQNNQAGPPPPPHKAPIKLGSDPNAPTTYEPPRPGPGEKRKSWLGKRLSRK